MVTAILSLIGVAPAMAYAPVDIVHTERVQAGPYSFGFQITGPQGVGQGLLTGVQVLDQPGPPMLLSWTIGSLPFLGLLAFIGIAWRRSQPGRQPLTI
jgi:hypothetical protein